MVLRALLERKATPESWAQTFDPNAVGAALFIITLRTSGLIQQPAAYEEELKCLRHMIHQINSDGGFYKYPGSPSSKSVTRVVLQALRMALGEFQSPYWPPSALAANPLLDGDLAHDIGAIIIRVKAYLNGGGGKVPLIFELDHKVLELVLLSYVGVHANNFPIPFLNPILPAAFESVTVLKNFKSQFGRLTRRAYPALSLLYGCAKERMFPGRHLHGVVMRVARLKAFQEHKTSVLLEAIRRSQAENGGWVYTPVLTMLNLMALRAAEVPLSDPAIQRSYRYLQRNLIPTPDGGHFVNFLESDLWNTALGVMTFLRFPGTSANSPAIRPAIEHLLRWQGRNGGFAFASGSRNDADTDSTALCLGALHHALETLDGAVRTRTREAVQRGREFLLRKQDRWGGFSGFDSTFVPSRPGGQGLLKQFLFDIAVPDVTARVLTSLIETGSSLADPRIRKSLQYLLRNQTSFGGWWSRWWAGYIPGTAFALLALGTAGIRFEQSTDGEADRLLTRCRAAMGKGITFLLRHQNADGGWGETIQADFDPRHAGAGPSTPLHTAQALRALLKCHFPPGSARIRRGMAYLHAQLTADGRWEDRQVTFTIFAKTYYYSYPLFAVFIPLLAVAEHQRATTSFNLPAQAAGSAG